MTGVAPGSVGGCRRLASPVVKASACAASMSQRAARGRKAKRSTAQTPRGRPSAHLGPGNQLSEALRPKIDLARLLDLAGLLAPKIAWGT
jgi:hypothetical protein